MKGEDWLLSITVKHFPFASYLLGSSGLKELFDTAGAANIFSFIKKIRICNKI